MVKYPLIKGKKQKLYNKFSDILIGSIRDTAPKKLPKNKKDITTSQFLGSPRLVKKYGLWADADKDKKINMFDSFPFDPKRHGIFKSIKKAVGGAAKAVGSVVSGGAKAVGGVVGGAVKAVTGSGKSSGSTSGKSSGGTSGTSGGTSSGGKSGTGGTTPSGGYGRSTNPQTASIPSNIPTPNLTPAQAASSAAAAKALGISQIDKSKLPSGQPVDISKIVVSKQSSSAPILGTKTAEQIVREATGVPEYTGIKKYFYEKGIKAGESTSTEPSGYMRSTYQATPTQTETFKGATNRTYENAGSSNKVPIEEKKNIIQKALEVENKVYSFIEKNTPKYYIRTKPSIFGGLLFGGGMTIIKEPGAISISELKKIDKEKSAKSYSQENLNARINNVNAVTEQIQNKWADKIATAEDGSSQFVGTEEEYVQYQQDFQTYEQTYNDYKNFEQNVQENQNTLFKVLKQGGEELGSKVINLLPETIGGLAFRGAELYGGARLGGAALGVAGRMYAGFAPEEQALLSMAGTGADVYIGATGVKGFMNPELSAGQRVVSLGFGLTGLSSLASKGAKASLKAVTKADELAKIKTIKPIVSQQFSVDNAIKIRTNEDGSTLWRVNGKISTHIKDAETGKLLQKIQSETFSDVVTSASKEGAVKATVDTYASSIDKYGIKKFVNEPKVTINAKGTKASGEFTFRPSQRSQKLTIARGDTEITDFGTFKGRATKEKITAKFTPKKVQPEARALSEVISGKVGENIAKRRITRNIEATGTEESYASVYRTDVTKEKLAVKGYSRRVRPQTKLEKFVEIKPFKKVKAYARRYPKQQLEKRTTGFGFQKVFTPEELSLDLSGIKIKSRVGRRGNIPSAREVPGGVANKDNALNLIVKQEQKERFAAQSATGAQQRVIARTQEESSIARIKKSSGKVSAKLIERTKGAQASLGRLWAGEREISRTIQKEKSATKNKLELAQKASTLTLQSSITSLIAGEKSSPASRTEQTQKQPSTLRQPQAPKGGQPAPPVNPTFPRETIPTPSIREGFPYHPRGEEKYKKEKPYDAYALVDSTNPKGKRYVKLNKEPLTQKSALSVMTRYVDENISARGKVIPAPETIRKGNKEIKIKVFAKDTGDSYYQTHKQKFRQYKTKKMIPLPSGVMIERQTYRLDRPAEVRQIQKGKREASVRNFFGM